MGLFTRKNGPSNRRNKPMARRPRGPEKIHMDKRRFGYFPKRFFWRGHRYDVEAVERCWTVTGRWQKVQRLCFRVRCITPKGYGGGTFELYQDLDKNSWHLHRILSRI